MTEERGWLVVPGDVWHIPQRRDSTVPIRRGTAQRLGLDLPPADMVLDVTLDLGSFSRAFKDAFDGLTTAIDSDQQRIIAAFKRLTYRISGRKP